MKKSRKEKPGAREETEDRQEKKTLIEFALLLVAGLLFLFYSIAAFSPYVSVFICFGYSLLSLAGFKLLLGKVKKRRDWLIIISVAGLAVGTMLSFGVYSGESSSGLCPGKVSGNGSATLTVKFFYSPFCSACLSHEPVKEAFRQAHLSEMRFEEFDVRNCMKQAEELGVYATPCYVFLNGKNQSVYCGARSQAELDALLETARA